MKGQTMVAISDKRALTAALLGFGLLVTAGCSAASSESTAPTNDKISIAAIAFNAQDPFWVSMQCGAQEAAKKRGVTLSWSAANSNALTEQQANFDAALLNKPDGVLLGAAQPDAFSVQVSTLMSDGTPVVAIAGPVNPDTAYQTIQESWDANEFFKLMATDLGAGSGTVGILGGIAGVPLAEARWKPFVEELHSAAPQVTALEPVFVDFDRNKATSAVAAMITGNPDLRAVYAVSGPEGEGAAKAVEEAGLSGKVKVYSYGATPALLDGLRNGTVSALLAQPSRLVGAASVNALVDYLQARETTGAVEQAKPATVNLPLRVLTQENVDDAESLPYHAVSSCD